MTRRDIPNVISIFRLLLVLPIAYLLYEKQLGLALVLFVIAGVSDGIDGYLAKRNGWTSALGAFLDPLADKTLLITSYLVLGWIGLFPLWLVVAVIARDAIIVIGSLAYFVLIGRVDMAPSIISKINTGAQIALVVILLLTSVFGGLEAVIEPMAYIVFVTTLLSGVGYVWVWGRKAWQNRGQSE
ncbi:MAG: CDP-alcohol phosphatidyltransferase family protein [Gammaproteobacteria bacterium]|nr:CDP-alcohol phosphatidyltransferase family protein [Gammaproteobacteria bacterium]